MFPPLPHAPAAGVGYGGKEIGRRLTRSADESVTLKVLLGLGQRAEKDLAAEVKDGDTIKFRRQVLAGLVRGDDGGGVSEFGTRSENLGEFNGGRGVKTTSGIVPEAYRRPPGQLRERQNDESSNIVKLTISAIETRLRSPPLTLRT